MENAFHGEVLTMKSKTILSTLLLSVATWAGSDFPQPPPVAVFAITDITQPGSPVKLSGIANAYVKLLTAGKYAGKLILWDEELGMVMTNVSNKPIVHAAIEVKWVDVRGVGKQSNTWDLDFSGEDTLYPGQSWSPRIPHAPGYRHVMTQSEFDSTKPVTPEAKAHLTSATFADGTTYTEPVSEGQDH